jgi:hypothetical protein
MGIRTEFPLADLSSAGGKITRGNVDTRLRTKNQTENQRIQIKEACLPSSMPFLRNCL